MYVLYKWDLRQNNILVITVSTFQDIYGVQEVATVLHGYHI